MNHIATLQAGRRALDERRNTERLEDVTWMLAGGECLSGAAARLGISTEALRAWCRRHAPHIGRQLSDREPRDPNQRPGIEAMRTRRAS